tara:strand:- start:98 stop:373 length:276 start_codon:yes stop_codon:yes gene_type:complete
MYFKELYNGKVNTQQIADVVINEIEMQLELYIEDNMQDTPNFEDLENILHQVKDAKFFPVQLELHTTAADLYKNNIIENIEDAAFRNHFYN